MGILDHLTCLLRSLYAGLELEATELTFRTGQGTMDWFKKGKEYDKEYCHPVYLVYM